VREDFSHCNSCIETNANFDNGLVLKIVKLKKKIRLKIRGMRFPVHFLIAIDTLGYFFFQRVLSFVPNLLEKQIIPETTLRATD